MPQQANTVPNKIPEVAWFDQELMAWRPPEDLTIAEWTEKKRVLSDQSEEKGPLRLIRTPYLVPIMNAAQDDFIEQIVVCKSAQIAGTEGGLSIIGYYSDQEPCPIMFVLADEDTATYMSRERLKKMYTKSPHLSYLAENTHFNKSEITLPNGTYIAMGWASSVAKLASRPIRVLVLDEIDKPGYYVTSKEAGPISLAEERTETFFRRKIFKLSTPTIETGNIIKELDSCDVVYDWHVPCSHCGVKQPLRWSRKYAWPFEDGKYRDENGVTRDLGQVQWEGGRNATDEEIEQAGYVCGSCGELWTTAEKNNAVEKGVMVTRGNIGKKKIRKVGFHINRIYSLLGNSGNIPKMVRDYIDCLSDPKKLQGFVNSTLAEPWKMVVTKSSEEAILKARVDLEPQMVPGDAIALTCGIDPQKVGFWFTVRAWARNFNSWLIHYGFLSSWDDVDNLLFNTMYPQVGSDKKFRIWRAAIDTGGTKFNERDPSMTEEAYLFVRINGVGRGCQVWATKGSARPLAGKMHKGKLLDQTPSGASLEGGVQLMLIDTDQMKDTVYYRLGNAITGDQVAAYLHKGVREDYAKQILAEEKQLNEKGQQVWIKVGHDNHYLDCEVLAHAVADWEWIGGGVNILSAALDIERKKREAIVATKKNRDVRRIKQSYSRPDWLDR